MWLDMSCGWICHVENFKDPTGQVKNSPYASQKSSFFTIFELKTSNL